MDGAPLVPEVTFSIESVDQIQGSGDGAGWVSVVFAAPADCPLDQGTWRLSGTADILLFLVPIGPLREGASGYEAVIDVSSGDHDS